MQDDAIAAGANRVAGADGAAVDIEPRAVDRPSRAVEAERITAEFRVFPGGEATQHLRREGFVQLPEIDVAEAELMAFHQRGRAIDRPQTHDRWIERRPFAVDDDGLR